MDEISAAVIDGITVTVQGGAMPYSEMEQYIKIFSQKYKDKRLERLEITLDGDHADINIYFRPVPFDRIRRITGYLVGNLDRFNDAKRAEVGDRVKHM